MQVRVPNRSLLAIFGAVTLSFSAQAMFEQGDQYAQQRGQTRQYAQTGQTGQYTQTPVTRADGESSSSSSEHDGATGKGCAKAANNGTSSSSSSSSDEGGNAQGASCGCSKQFTRKSCSQSIKTRGYLAADNHFQQVNSLYTRKQHAHGVRGSRLPWQGSKWDNMYSRHMRLKRVDQSNSQFDNTNLRGHWKHYHCDGCTLTNSTWRGTFRDVTFKNSTFRNFVFKRSKLGSKFTQQPVNFEGGEMDNVWFQGDSIRDASLHNTKMKNVTIDCTKVRNPLIFAGAQIWDGTQYISPSSTQLENLGQHLGQCRKSHKGKKGGSMNLTQWLQGN